MILFDKINPEFNNKTPEELKSELMAKYAMSQFDDVFWACAVRVANHPSLIIDFEVYTAILAGFFHLQNSDSDAYNIYLPQIIGTLEIHKELNQLANCLNFDIQEIAKMYFDLLNNTQMDVEEIFREIKYYFMN